MKKIASLYVLIPLLSVSYKNKDGTHKIIHKTAKIRLDSTLQSFVNLGDVAGVSALMEPYTKDFGMRFMVGRPNGIVWAWAFKGLP